MIPFAEVGLSIRFWSRDLVPDQEHNSVQRFEDSSKREGLATQDRKVAMQLLKLCS
jgi:hypothetical protein